VNILRETTFQPLGVTAPCPLKFLHALEIDQGLLAHTPTGTPPPKKLQKNLKVWPKLQHVSPYNFVASGNIFINRFQEM